MGDLAQIAEAFDGVDGIDAHVSSLDRVLVKVMDEDAVGQMYRVARQEGVELSAVSRNHIDSTVLDAWADLE